MKYLKTIRITCFDNSLDAWVPEVWAAETLAILEENMVIGNLVHTDFADEIATFGDTVNTRRPAAFTAKRKTANDDVTVQNADATNVPVVLNQHFHTSFLIRDGQESLAMVDLTEEYLKPAAKSLAEAVDRVLLGQVYQFLANAVGELNALTTADIKDLMLDAREKLNENKAHMAGRQLVLTTRSETEALKEDVFLEAEKMGDDGSAMREASLGRKLGFDTYMCQNASSVTVAALEAVDANYLGAAIAVGDTSWTMDGGNILNGEYFLLESDQVPYRCMTGGGVGTPITVSRGARVANDSTVSDVYRVVTGLVDLAGHTAAGGPTAYAAGYAKEIKVDGTGVPHVGQLVAFSTAASAAAIAGEYCIIDIPATGYIVLDRPLDLAIGNDYVVDYGPIGEYNFAFHRNALALVTRPLAQPKSGTGALSGVANYNGLSMRVTITYNGTKQGHLVTLDCLAGVKVLDENLGAVMQG